ncbi:MAG: PQQ-binding-like beta-propeller repeat protein [Pirellulaceae bacterium]
MNIEPLRMNLLGRWLVHPCRVLSVPVLVLALVLANRAMAQVAPAQPPAPSESLAASIQLDFPAASGVLSQDRQSCLLIGGHSLARLDLQSMQVVQQHNLESYVFSAIAALQNTVVVAGAADIENGFVGRCRYDDLSQFEWINDDLEFPATSVCAAGDLVIAGNERGELMAFAAGRGELRWKKSLHSKLVTSLAALGEQQCASSDWTGKLIIFDTTDGHAQTDFQQHRDRVTALATPNPISASSPVRLFSGSRDGTARLWYADQRRLVRFVQLESPVTSIAVLDEALIVAATRDARLHVIDMSAAKVIRDYAPSLQYITHVVALDNRHVLALDGRGSAQALKLH